jgi:protoporphyrinogen IX oxidase
MNYTSIKAVHLISVVAWYAGLFYIFRLFVYHVKYRHVTGLHAVYLEMEEKLLHYIMLPAMLASLTCGGWMVIMQPQLLNTGWMRFKLGCVVVLLAYQGLAEYVHVRFRRGDALLTELACRWYNELPTVMLVGIVVAVVVRPF